MKTDSSRGMNGPFYVLFLVLALAIIVNHVNAAWYVSTARGLDTNVGDSPSAPWQTLSKACTTLASNTDKTPLYIDAGNYALTASCTLNRDVIGNLSSSGALATNIQLSGIARLFYNTLSWSNRVVNLTITATSTTNFGLTAYKAPLLVSNVEFISTATNAMVVELTTSTVEKCRFTGTTGTKTQMILILSSTVTISDTTFESIYGTTCASILMGSSIVNVNRCTFKDIQGSSGAGIASTYSMLNVTDSTFSNVRTIGNNVLGAGIFFTNATSKDLFVINSEFRNMNALVGASIATNSARKISVTGSRFYDSNTPNEGGALYVSNVEELEVERSDFRNLTASPLSHAGAILVNDGDYITKTRISNSNFTQCFSKYGGAIAIRFTASAQITQSRFEENSGSFGSSLYLLSTDSRVSDCSFRNTHAAQFGAGIYFYDYSPGNTKNLTVDKCHFSNLSAIAGAGITLTFAGRSTVTNSQFYNNSVSDQGAGFYSESIDYVSISDSTFDSNKARNYFAGASLFNSSGSVNRCTFTNNYANFTGAGLGFHTAQRLVATREPPTIRTSVSDSTFSGNTVGSMLSTNASSSLSFLGYLYSEVLGGSVEHTIEVIPAVQLVGGITTISPSPSDGLMPRWSGLTVGTNNITLNGDMTIEGSVMLINHFIPLSGDRTRLNWIYLNSHTLTMKAFASRINHLQSIVANNGTIELSREASTFCCNTDSDVLGPIRRGLDFYDTNLLMSDSAVVNMKSTLNPMRFFGSSIINATTNSIFLVRNAAKAEVQVDNFHIGSATLWASDFILSGNLLADYRSSVAFYPTWWNGVNKPMEIGGDAIIDGTFLLQDIYQLPPFSYPSFDDAPALVLTVNGTLIIEKNITSPNGVYYTPTILDHSVYGKATHFQPTATLDANLGSIVLNFITDSNLTVPLDCTGLIDKNPANNLLDLPSLRCVRKNSTQIVVSSAVLPVNKVLNIEPDHPTVKTSPSGIQNPEYSLAPKPIIRPFSAQSTCGSIILDGTLSQGIGSYPGAFSWRLASTNDTNERKTAINELLINKPSDASVVDLEMALFTPGCEYRFELNVTNAADVSASTLGSSTFVLSSEVFAPPLAHDGPSSRQVFRGSEVVLKGIIDNDRCDWMSSSKTRFEWTLWNEAEGSQVQLELPSAATPSLFLPSSYFDFASPSQQFTFTLNAYPESAPVGVKSTISFVVTVGAKPLTVVSTSRSSFFIDETVALSAEAVSHLGESINALWSIVACPKSFADDWFKPTLASGSNSTTYTGKGYECINSTGSPFKFPFTSTSGLNTTVLPGTLEAGNYVVGLNVSTASEQTTILIPFTLYGSNNNLPPQVSISLPSADEIYANQKVVLSAVVDQELEGIEAMELFSFDWRVRFGNLDIPSERNGLSFLVIPFGSMVADQELFVEVKVKRKSLPDAAVGSAIVQVPVARAPTGGILQVSPSSGTSGETLFSLTASKWTSPFWPLRYQFSVLDENGIENSLSEAMDVPTLNNITLFVPGHADKEVTLRVRVLDSLGSISSADYLVLVRSSNPIPQKRSVLDAYITTAMKSLDLAVNSSDWRGGYRVLTSDLINRELVDLLDSDAIDKLWKIVSTLPLSNPLTESNVAATMTQLNHILSKVEISEQSQLQSLLLLLDTILTSESSRFGTDSIFAIESSNYFVNTIARLLQTPQSKLGDLSVDPLSLIRDHSTQVLDSFLPGEPQYARETGTVNVAAALLLADLETPEILVSTPNSPVQVSFEPSTLPASSDPDSHIGYTFSYFNGTFPHPMPGQDFNQVVEIRIERVSATNSNRRRVSSVSEIHRTPKTRKRSSGTRDLVQGPTRTTFNITETTLLETEKTATCTRWDDSSNSWTSSGCVSTRSGATVQCDCTQGGPLTLLFSARPGDNGVPDNGGSPKNNKSKTPASTIAAAIVVPLAILAVIGIIIGWKLYQNRLHRGPTWSTKKVGNSVHETPHSATSVPTSVVTSSGATTTTTTAAAAAEAATPTPPESRWTRSAKPKEDNL